MQGGNRRPFRDGGHLTLLVDPPLAFIGLVEFADMAYVFMTGIPSKFGSRGFCMMDPEVLKKQRITFVKYWLRKLEQEFASMR